MNNKLTATVIATLVTTFTLGVSICANAQDNPENWPSPMHDNEIMSKWMLDRLEWRNASNTDSGYWEAQAWIGGDINKLWLKTEGSVTEGDVDDADLEAYYSRAVSAFWDAQVGVRHDFSTSDTPSRNWLGFGFEGLAPYLFEVDATLYVGDNWNTAFRFKGEYDLLLTQRWVFMPEIELNAYGQEDVEYNQGSGLSDASLTLRLRYDIRRELSPYVGLMWTQLYGGTADLASDSGEPTSEAYVIVGIRAWW